MKPSAKIGYLTGTVVALIALLVLVLPRYEKLHTRGPSNTGHESLACQDCHLPAPGTTRQQMQANVRHALGRRASPVDFGHQEVTNADCLACHERPQDNHPVHRFNEPRFAEARASIQPQQCVSCHLEHKGIRVTIEPTFCIHCHQGLELKNEPLNVSHQELIAADNWSSCLGCHDFHGNHVMDLKTVVKDALALDQIIEYFNGSLSPYSNEKSYSAKESRNE